MNLKTAVLAALQALISSTACTPVNRVVISATENRFVPSSLDVQSGRVRIELRNVGHSSHALALEGQPGKVIVHPSERRVMILDLPPGVYRFSCPLNGHDTLGMLGTIIARP
jgi:plastocyanin